MSPVHVINRGNDHERSVECSSNPFTAVQMDRRHELSKADKRTSIYTLRFSHFIHSSLHSCKVPDASCNSGCCRVATWIHEGVLRPDPRPRKPKISTEQDYRCRRHVVKSNWQAVLKTAATEVRLASGSDVSIHTICWEAAGCYSEIQSPPECVCAHQYFFSPPSC